VRTGPDHGVFDIVVKGSLWQSVDAYTPTPGERVINLFLTQSAAVTLELRVRADRNLNATGYKLGFRRLALLETTFEQRTIRYTYDALSRIREADHGAAQYTYAFDLAGNLTHLNGAARTFNGVNQMINDGTNPLTYDPNGNLSDDGPNAYTWDRANRLLSLSGTHHGMSLRPRLKG
jgi:hypothetical protein